MIPPHLPSGSGLWPGNGEWEITGKCGDLGPESHRMPSAQCAMCNVLGHRTSDMYCAQNTMLGAGPAHQLIRHFANIVIVDFWILDDLRCILNVATWSVSSTVSRSWLATWPRFSISAKITAQHRIKIHQLHSSTLHPCHKPKEHHESWIGKRMNECFNFSETQTIECYCT